MDGCSGIGRNWLASPMGIAFNEEGDLFICDNQGWSGAEKAQNKGRVLRLKFENDQLKETITVASGMEHPNGLRIRNGKLYVTQSSLSQIKDPSGLLVSGVYCFDMNDRDVAVTNTLEDKNLITTVITKEPRSTIRTGWNCFQRSGRPLCWKFR